MCSIVSFKRNPKTSSSLESFSVALRNCEKDLGTTRQQLSETQRALDNSVEECLARQTRIDNLLEAQRKSEAECVQLTQRLLKMKVCIWKRSPYFTHNTAGKNDEAERMNEIAAMYEDARIVKENAKQIRETQSIVIPITVFNLWRCSAAGYGGGYCGGKWWRRSGRDLGDVYRGSKALIRVPVAEGGQEMHSSTCCRRPYCSPQQLRCYAPHRQR